MRFSKHFIVSIFLSGAVFLSACQEGETKQEYPRNPSTFDASKDRKTVFGEGGLGNLFSGSNRKEGAVLGVNAYLWRASLDTVSFMPIASADPFGGTILTDFYASSQAPNERFKLNILIMDSELRADGVRVSVFRQVQDERGNWQDAPTDKKTATDLENTILSRARALKVAQDRNS